MFATRKPAPTKNFERGQANRDNRKQKFEANRNIADGRTRTPEKLAAHMPARFKTEDDCGYANSDSAEQRDDMQSFVGSWKEFYPAKINRGQQSSESNAAEIGLGEISGETEPEKQRDRQPNSERRSFATVAILPIANQKIWNHQEKQDPKKHWVWRPEEERHFTRAQPHDRPDYVDHRAERGSKQINNGNAQQQPNPHKVGERSLDLISLTDQRDRRRDCGDIED